jgi:hypothetical protein
MIEFVLGKGGEDGGWLFFPLGKQNSAGMLGTKPEAHQTQTSHIANRAHSP